MSEKKRKVTGNWFVEILVLSVLIGVDWLSKWWFVGEQGSGLLNIEGALGLPFGKVSHMVVVLCLAIMMWLKTAQGMERWGLLLVVAGGVGNLADRLLYGGVRDFIYYPFFQFYGNVADIYLTMGVIVVVGGFVLRRERMGSDRMAA